MRLKANGPIIAIFILLVVTIGSVSFYSFLQVEAQPIDPIIAGIPDVPGDSIMISEQMVCLVTDIGTIDGWVTYDVKATRYALDGAGPPPIILDVKAEYIPHDSTGAHLAAVTQQLIYGEGANPGGFVQMVEFGSISVPAHEDESHTHLVKFSHSGIAGTKDVHVGSCKS